MYRPVASGSTQTWADYLHDLKPSIGSLLGPLAELRASLANLATTELDRLLTETLDTCSHRLDVWLTAFACGTEPPARPDGAGPGQLASRRVRVAGERAARHPASTVTGAAADAVARLDESRRTLRLGSALPPAPQPLPDNGEFIHAPSMTQAAVGPS